MRSERKCSIFDLLWPDPSILEGESEKFVFLENKNIFEEKKYLTFLVLLGSTCVQNLRQFEFLTLAIKNFIFVWFLHGCPLNTEMYKKLSCTPCLLGPCDEALLEVKSFSLSTQCKRNRLDCPQKSYQKLWLFTLSKASSHGPRKQGEQLSFLHMSVSKHTKGL